MDQLDFGGGRAAAAAASTPTSPATTKFGVSRSASPRNDDDRDADSNPAMPLTHPPFEGTFRGAEEATMAGEVGRCSRASRLNLKTRGRFRRGPSTSCACAFTVVAAATTPTTSSKHVIPASRAAGPATGFPFTATRMSPARRTSRPATGPNRSPPLSGSVVDAQGLLPSPVFVLLLDDDCSASALVVPVQTTAVLIVCFFVWAWHTIIVRGAAFLAGNA